MILKYFELKKINFKNSNLILFYGKNDGLKKQSIKEILRNNKETVENYEEKEVLENYENFIENLLTKSLFDEKKILIINRATDKILNTIKEIKSKNIEDLIVILNADNLEKKSKLRSFFEKEKNYICVAFYQDNFQTLNKIADDFLREKKILISHSNINQIINKCNNDRLSLINELKKIELFCKNGRKISDEVLLKLINLSENHNISELIDSCLVKNQKKTITIINENNFGNEDCILIIRTFLNKLKRILKLSIEFKKNKNIDLTIASAKPPIFWKDKEITIQQIYKWDPAKLRQVIYKANEIELNIKRNINNSINIITDFILENSIQKN